MKPEHNSTCENMRAQFALLLYGELSFDEEEQMESHLDGCPECRAALAKQREIHQAVDLAAVTPSPTLLARCREDLSAVLAHAPAAADHALGHFPNYGTGWWRQLVESFHAARWRPAFVPAGAVAMLAVGFLAGQMVPRTSGSGAGAQLADITGASIRNVSAQQDGRVAIVLDETRQRQITGTLDDRAIRTLLLTASREAPDPALRANTVAILVNRAGAEDVRNALMFALENDRSERVRSRAMEGLQPYATDRQVQNALAQVLLRDADRAIRARAVDLLVSHDQQDLDREIVGDLQELMDHEADNYVRERGLRVLRAMRASSGIY